MVLSKHSQSEDDTSYIASLGEKVEVASLDGYDAYSGSSDQNQHTTLQLDGRVAQPSVGRC